MANKKGLDGYFMKYGITQMDLQIIESVCQVAEVDPDWLEEEILAPYQQYKNSGDEVKGDVVEKILNKALDNL